MKSYLGYIALLFATAASGSVQSRFPDLVVSGAVKVGAKTAADSKSVLDLQSTTKGMLPPRMTTTQRDAITSPPTGLVIYNTTTAKLNQYNGASWSEVQDGVVPVSNGGTGQSSLALNNLVLGNGTSAVQLLAPGASGNIATSNGTTWQSVAPAAATTTSSARDIVNAGFSVTTSSSTLIVSLKQSDGTTDPNASNPVRVSFRGTNAAAGNYTQSSFTSATSITLGTTDSIGCPATGNCLLYVYLIADTTSDICLSYTLFDERVLQSATALTGGADTSGTTLYCTNAHTSKPIRLIGRVLAIWSNPNWGSIGSPYYITTGQDSNVSATAPGLLRVEEIRVAGTCSSSPCVVDRQPGSAVSTVTRGGTGNYTVNFYTGVFSSTPICVCTADNVTQVCQAGTQSATAWQVVTALTNTAAATDGAFLMICVGPR